MAAQLKVVGNVAAATSKADDMLWPQLGQTITGPVEAVTGGRAAWHRTQARSAVSVNVSPRVVAPCE